MKLWVSALVGGVVVLLTACGHFVLTPTSPPGHPPSPGAPIILTEPDSGRSISVVVGQEIDVHLGQGRPEEGVASPLVSWHSLQSTNPAVLRLEETGEMESNPPVLFGRFLAVAPGKANITAIAGPTCRPGTMCPMIAERLFTVSVTVVHA